MIIIIIIINFFNKKVVKRNFTNGKENGVQIIVSAIVQVIAYEIEVVVFYAVFFKLCLYWHNECGNPSLSSHLVDQKRLRPVSGFCAGFIHNGKHKANIMCLSGCPSDFFF